MPVGTILISFYECHASLKRDSLWVLFELHWLRWVQRWVFNGVIYTWRLLKCGINGPIGLKAVRYIRFICQLSARQSLEQTELLWHSFIQLRRRQASFPSLQPSLRRWRRDMHLCGLEAAFMIVTWYSVAASRLLRSILVNAGNKLQRSYQRWKKDRRGASVYSLADVSVNDK